MKYQIYITGSKHITVMMRNNKGAERCSRDVEYNRQVASTLDKRTDSRRKGRRTGVLENKTTVKIKRRTAERCRARQSLTSTETIKIVTDWRSLAA